MFAYLLQGLALGATAAAQPGPFQAFLLSLVARYGWRRSLPAALAPLLSDGPMIALVLFVLTRLPASGLAVLRLAGGLFLMWLAWGAWRAFREAIVPAAHGSQSASMLSAILKASAMNLLSPSPYIFWATIAGPILIAGWQQAPAIGLAFLLGFYVAIIAGLGLFIIVAGLAGRVDPRVNRAFAALSAVALFAFALFQLVTGLRGLFGS